MLFIENAGGWLIEIKAANKNASNYVLRTKQKPFHKSKIIFN